MVAAFAGLHAVQRDAWPGAFHGQPAWGDRRRRRHRQSSSGHGRPGLWDGMAVAERVAMLLEGSAGGAHGAAGSDLVSLALAVPRTIAFTILALSQIFEVSAIRSGEASFFQKWYRDNRLLFVAVIATFVLQMLVIYEPFLQAAFDTAALTGQQLAVSLGLASTVLFAVEIEKAIRRRRHRKHSEA